MFAFARLAGWTLFDPLVSRLPISMRLFMAAVLAAVLMPGLSIAALDPFTVQGLLALPLLALMLLIQLAFGIVARTTPGLDMVSVGLGVGMLGLMVVWVWACRWSQWVSVRALNSWGYGWGGSLRDNTCLRWP